MMSDKSPLRTRSRVAVLAALLALGALAAGGCKGGQRKGQPKLVVELQFSVNYPNCKTERLQAIGVRMRAALIKRLVGRYGATAREAITEAVEARVVRWRLIIRLGADYAKDLDDVKQVATQLGLIGTSKPSIVIKSKNPAQGEVRIGLDSKIDDEIMRSGTQTVAESFRRRVRDC